MSEFVIPQDNLTEKLLGPNNLPKYAVFLPAISCFYTGMLGGRRDGSMSFDPSRIPVNFENGMAGLDWMDKQNGYFTYAYGLYSAGHANLDINDPGFKESMIYNRDREYTTMLGDSGGFQIGKGVWTADWKDPNCPKAMSKRKEVLLWLDQNFDYSMILDIPAWVRKTERGRNSSGISTFDQAISATSINNEYFMRNRSGKTKFLNVVQGSNHAESDLWYSKMKKFCDPKQYEDPFNGWAFGSQQACDPHLTLKRLVDIRFDGLMQEGVHDWLHVLGNSNMEWVLLLSDIQRAIRKYVNPKFTISYDAASPVLSVTNGGIYNGLIGSDPNRWTFPQDMAIDDKKYFNDSRLYKEVAEQDGYCKTFLDSPITKRLKISDICHYSPTAINKLGKIGNKSWDSFSYGLLMAHSTWTHIEGTQEANRRYDTGQKPSVMSTIGSAGKKGMLYFDRLYCSDIIDDIFATSSKSDAMALIEHYTRYWLHFRGVRGNFGKKAKNSLTAFNHIFQEV